MINWAYDERKHAEERKPIVMPPFYDEGIFVPHYIEYQLGPWERQSIPLLVSDNYQKIIFDFKEYFEKEY